MKTKITQSEYSKTGNKKQSQSLNNFIELIEYKMNRTNIFENSLEVLSAVSLKTGKLDVSIHNVDGTLIIEFTIHKNGKGCATFKQLKDAYSNALFFVDHCIDCGDKLSNADYDKCPECSN